MFYVYLESIPISLLLLKPSRPWPSSPFPCAQCWNAQVHLTETKSTLVQTLRVKCALLPCLPSSPSPSPSFCLCLWHSVILSLVSVILSLSLITKVEQGKPKLQESIFGKYMEDNYAQKKRMRQNHKGKGDNGWKEFWHCLNLLIHQNNYPSNSQIQDPIKFPFLNLNSSS